MPTKTGPAFVQSAANVTGVGSVPWNNVSNLPGDTNNSANVNLSLGATTNYIVGSSPDWATTIPDEALIVGVQAEFEVACRFADIIDNQIRLQYHDGSGVVMAPSTLTIGGTWPTVNTYRIYGDSTELWGLSAGTLNGQDVKHSDFGARLSCTLSNFNPDRPATVRRCRMSVWWELPPSGNVLFFGGGA